jgi:signal transduction histidine kinase
LLQATEQLRRADDAKRDLLAKVVHELRQPIQTALTAVALVRTAQDEKTQAWANDMAERMLIQISRITSDLLDVAHMDRGDLALQLTPQDLCAVLRRSLETFRSMSAEHGMTIATSFPEGPVPVEADAARLEQVFGNLLSNAIRYTPAGGRVDVSVAATPNEARVIIADTGEGIRPEDLSRIFHAFVRASARPGGLGIGLSVARSLVESHGGTLTAHSDGPGKGSTFTVTLRTRTRHSPEDPEP